MKLKQTAGKDFSADLAPAGMHPAVCIAVIDLGTHTPDKGYQGQPPKPARKLFVVWELVEESTRPVVWKDFTASLNDKAKLRQFLKTWRGKDVAEGEEFDIGKIAGAKCLLTISHSKSGDRTFANVESAGPPMKGMTIKEPDKSIFKWFIEDGEPFHGPGWDLPYWYGRELGDAIKNCAELKGAPDREFMGDNPQPAGVGAGADEDQPEIPF